MGPFRTALTRTYTDYSESFGGFGLRRFPFGGGVGPYIHNNKESMSYMRQENPTKLK